MPARQPAFNRNRRRVLELLAGSPQGCTEAILLAHGNTAAQLASVLRDGFAIERAERMKVSGREMLITRLYITDAGQKAIGG